MQNDLVFKTGLVKRTLGWFVCAGAAGAMIAMIYGVLTHPEAQIPSELWSAFVIGIFLVGLMAAGISAQYIRWSIEGENIVYRGLVKKKTIPLSNLGGFGQIIVIVVAFPFQNLDLYDRQLKHVARFPVNLKDWPRAEAWFSTRFRRVVNDGSHILPKYRFTDTPKT